MLESDTLREGKKKLETKFIFPIDRDRDNVVLGLPRRRPSSKLLTNFLPSISPLEYFERVEPIYEDSYEIKAKIFSTLLLIIYPSISLFTGSQLEYT